MGRLLYLSHSTENSPGAAIFGRDILFEIPFLDDWPKIGEYIKRQTDKNTDHENNAHVD
jgi:hypothetical protein